MGKGIFVTGTATDVGKTYVTGLIINISSVDKKGSSKAAYLHSFCFLTSLG